MKALRQETLTRLETLKIAFQFTKEVIPTYLTDAQAELIGKDIQNRETENTSFLHDYIIQNVTKGYDHYCDFGHHNKRYVLLTSHKELGLICTICLPLKKLSVVMSNKTDYLNNDDFIVGVNNICEKKFKIYNTLTAVNKLYDKGYLQLHVDYGLPKEGVYQKLCIVIKEHTEVALYNRNGKIVYGNLLEMLEQPHLSCKKINRPKLNLMGLQYTMDEMVYVEYHGVLFRVDMIDQYWIKTSKL